jgi:hypothetical protein
MAERPEGGSPHSLTGVPPSRPEDQGAEEKAEVPPAGHAGERDRPDRAGSREGDGTTRPASAAPAGSSGPVGVAPPKGGQAKWLAIAAAGVLGVILILLLLA